MKKRLNYAMENASGEATSSGEFEKQAAAAIRADYRLGAEFEAEAPLAARDKLEKLSKQKR